MPEKMSNVAQAEFRLGDLLSITSGIQLSLQGLDGTARVLTHMLDEKNMHPSNVPAALELCRMHLLQQHPWLGGLTPPEWILNRDTAAWLWSWLDTQEIKYGSHHQVESLPAGTWQPITGEDQPYVRVITAEGDSGYVPLDELPIEVQDLVADLMDNFDEDDFEDDDEEY